MLVLSKRIWWKWKGLAHRIIAAQNWFLMAMVYWLAVAPVAVLMKIGRQKLLERDLEPAESYWRERTEDAFSRERSQRMF